MLPGEDRIEGLIPQAITGGGYHRLYPEETIRNFNGVHVKIEEPFDSNRNRAVPVDGSPRDHKPGEYPLSERAAEKRAAVPVSVSVDRAGADLAMNPASVALGHPAGRNERNCTGSTRGPLWPEVTDQVVQLVRASPPQASVTVSVASEKGGTHRSTLALGGA